MELQFFKDSKTSCASSSSVTWPLGFLLGHFLTCLLSSVHQHSLSGFSYQYHMPLLWSSSVQSLSRVQLFVTPWTTAHQASLSITNSWSLPKLMSIESAMPSSHLILCRPLLLLPSIFPSICVFSNELALLIRWSKYWSFSFSISPSNEHSGLISFKMDWLDLLVVQGTLKSLLQHHSSKASILRHSAFFIVQLSHPYIVWYWFSTVLVMQPCPSWSNLPASSLLGRRKPWVCFEKRGRTIAHNPLIRSASLPCKEALYEQSTPTRESADKSALV